MNIRLYAALLAAPLFFACAEATAPDPIATVTVSASVTTLPSLGATTQASAVAVTAGGKTPSAPTVTWMSANGGVASVSPTGLITAVGNGTTIITAMAGGISGTISITVSQAVASITITPASVPTVAALGATVALTAAAADANSNPITGVAFTWTSSAGAIATVSGAGVVTAVANGTATISAAAQGVTSTRSITVTQAVASVVITPGTLASVPALGNVYSFTAAVRDSRNIAVAGAAVTWSTTAAAVATVSTAGQVTSVANGTTRIIAASGAFRDTVLVTVSQVAASIDLTCVNYIDLPSVGATVQCNAILRDSNTRPMTGSFIWTSSNANVATVSNTGLVTGVDNGGITLTAQSGSIVATRSVFVDLAIPLGSTRTGRVRASGVGQGWDVTGTNTRANYMMWVHRSPYTTSTLNPNIYFTTTSGGVNTVRLSSSPATLTESGSDLYARADMPHSTANTDVIVRGGTTTGDYVLGVSSCRIPHATLAPGFYSGGGVITTDCAALILAYTSTQRFAPASSGIVAATAGQAVTIEIIGDCTGCGTGRLADPVLYVFGPNDGQVWFNDDGSGIGLNSRVTFTAPTTGNYTLLVADLQGRTGAYAVCAFSGCTAYAPPALNAPTTETTTASLTESGATAPVRVPSYSAEGWKPSLTVERAYEALKAAGAIPADYDPRLHITMKPNF